MKAWHEQDEFWETFGPAMFPPERFESAAVQIDGVLGFAGVDPGATVLDLACGPGRHALELARRGYTVTGVDRTAAYLAQAAAQAGEEGLEIEWVHDDMRSFTRPGAFDLAINLFTAFGYFEDPEDDRRVAANLVAALRSGGTLVMDLIGKEILARKFRSRDWRELPDGSYLLEERRIRSGWDWVESRWLLIDDESRREFTLSHRLYSATELSALVEASGCALVEVYGALDGRDYDHEAKRLTLVGRKAE
jgi:SAM-dependent methyltransferase